MERTKYRYCCILMAASGLLCCLPYNLSGLWVLGWVGLAPALGLLFRLCPAPRIALQLGLWFSVPFYLGVYYWLLFLYPLDWLGFSRWLSAAAILSAWLGLAGLQGAVLALAFWLHARLRGEKSAPGLLACLWVLAEFTHGLGPLGVAWGRLALTQQSSLPTLQSLSLFGTLGLAFLMVLVNGLLAQAAVRFRRGEQRPAVAAAGLAAVVFLLNLGYGRMRLATWPALQENVRVAIVQGNVASGEKWQENSAIDALALYESLTLQAVTQGADLVLWPETAVPVAPRIEAAYDQHYRNLAAQNALVLATGGFDHDAAGNSFNGIFTYLADGSSPPPSYKRRLVPFGEFLPYRSLLASLLPFTKQFNLTGSDLSPGSAPALAQTPYGQVGYLICFDSIWPALTREAVSQGANILLLATNDSWYKNSPALRQHQTHALLRAVESGRYVVRGANTGISCIISPVGRITASLPPQTAGVLTGKVAFLQQQTLYTRLGDVILLLCCGYISLVVFYGKGPQPRPEEAVLERIQE